MGNDKQPLYTIITPEQAKKQNQRETAGGSNSEYMSFKGDPRYPSEYFSPEELDASVVKAFKSKEEEEAFKRKQLEKQVATMMNAYDWKRPLATRGPNQGDTSLQNIAAASIGAPLLLLNPATSTIATGPIAHAIEVAMNPLAAETTLGAFLGTGAQAAGITAGIYNASNTIDKWLNGNFDLYDIPYFALDAASTIPVFNTVAGLADDAVRMTQNAYRTQRAARNATKPMTHGDPGLAQDYINAAGNAEGISVPTVKPPYTQTDVDKVRQALNFNDVPNVENPFGDSALEILNKVKRGNYVNEFDASRIPKNPGYHPLQYPYLPDKVFDKLGIDSYKLKPTYMKEFVSMLDDIPADEMLSVIRPQSTRHFNYDWDGDQSFWGTLMKLDANRHGYTLEGLDDWELAKFLQWRYNTMVQAQHGPAKGIIGYSGVKGVKPLDKYNKYLSGSNLGNAGRAGSGMYFGTKPGYTGPIDGYNVQPYLFYNIDDIVPKHKLGYSHNEYPGNYIKSYLTSGKIQHLADKLNIDQQTLRNVIYDLSPDESRFLVVDPEGLGNIGGFVDRGIDFRYRGPNQNVKSVFPHPSRFVKDPDGTVRFIPDDFTDPRHNFKNGGRLLKIENPDQ